MEPTPAILAALFAVSFVAGLVDAIAGGGGLLTLPSLLAAGLPPHLALGTNKGQSVFGAAAAVFRFARAGKLDLELARITFPLGLVGSLAGATVVTLISPDALRPLVLVLLLTAGAFIAFRSPSSAHPLFTVPPPWAAPALALGVGTYDGFFGPGTGTFLIVGFVALLGRSLTLASADAKVVNFASNLAAVGLFASRGLVVWELVLPMAVGQFLGATIGAHLTVKGGDQVVKRVVLLVVLAMTIDLGRKLLWE